MTALQEFYIILNMKETIKKALARLVGAISLLPMIASAHEAYVVPKDYFWRQMSQPLSFKAFTTFKNIHNLAVISQITMGVFVLILLNFLFRRTQVGAHLHKFLESFSYLGPIFVRLAIATAFFFGVQSGDFLGPELLISRMPLAEIMRWGIYVSSFMILFGIFTEVAAFIGLIVFSVGFFSFGTYITTYLNYLGELVALFIFGMRKWSFDGLIFGPLKKWRHAWERYGTTIVRIFYGTALIYAAINVKLLRTDLTLRVINDWNLTRFYWLFPSDPLLVVLGAGLAEAMIGLLIILGFEMRMTVIISLFYITLSLLFFRELVWPHILLYGISLNLIVQPEIFTLDNLFFREKKTVT